MALYNSLNAISGNIHKYVLEIPIQYLNDKQRFGVVMPHVLWLPISLGCEDKSKAIREFEKNKEPSYYNFLHKILSQHHNDTVLLVGHNGINKAMIAVITGKNPEDIKSIDLS